MKLSEDKLTKNQFFILVQTKNKNLLLVIENQVSDPGFRQPALADVASGEITAVDCAWHSTVFATSTSNGRKTWTTI